MNNKKVAFILNPIAGKGTTLKKEKEIINYLHKKEIPYYLEYTREPQHAKEIAKRLSNEYNLIVAIGGDGTANEVAYGIIGSNASLGYLPIGSGNDFNRIIGMPKKIPDAIEKILNGKRKIIDIGNVEVKNSSGLTKKSIFINTLGIGIDANIAKEVKRVKYLRGFGLYLVATIKVMISFRPIKLKIKVDNKSMQEELYLFCVGNGKYEGGGFKMVPDAVPDDGLLNICLAKKMPLIDAFKAIPMVIKGNHNAHPKVEINIAKKIELSSQDIFTVHTDGEVIEDKAKHIKIGISKEQLSVVTF